jgi:REP element-mobilizing transposase RayT
LTKIDALDRNALMPRKARIDAPGALHHVIGRGIARRKIFQDDDDRENFLERLGNIVTDSGTQCYAWALIPNHFHLLLKTGDTPIATVMRRLLTGYAVSFNRRHRRFGHLFQNRYKSILCQEDTYLAELVRYIHLNPLRARLVADIKHLDVYPFCGHGVVLGKCDRPWQNAKYVLKRFADQKALARRRYRAFVEKGVKQGKKPELTGGGLVRSAGGWVAVKALRRSGDYQKGDERILGDGDFVAKTLARADQQLERKYRIKNRGVGFDTVVERVATLLEMETREVLSPGKQKQLVQARSLVCFLAVQETTISQAELARRFSLSQPAISMAVDRGRQLAAAMEIDPLKLIN